MAAWHDLKHRTQTLEDSGLSVATDYKGAGLPKWLVPALGGCDVYVLNAKGVALDDTLCIVRLSRLEALLEGGGVGILVDKILAQEDAVMEQLLTKITG